MKKNRIWIVITLMTLALIGLSWFQVFWINSVIELSKERFEKDALASMMAVANRLERNEMAVVATNSFAFFGTGFEDKDSSYRQTITVSANSDSSQQQIWFKTNTNENIRIIIASDSSEEIHEFIGDTSFVDEDVEIMATFIQDTAITQVNLKRLNKKKQVFTKVVEEMIFHEAGRAQRVHPGIIDSLLRQELHNHGIDLDFNFGVYDVRNKEYTVIKTTDKKALETSSLAAALFPNDILGNTLSLVVSFPDKNRFLMEKVWGPLVISFVFILIIIGIFAYVIYTIIHQKKLAELKNDFINNMTHEFKTPIATVSLATEALMEDKVYKSRQTMLRYVGVIQEESQRLGRQVEKVLQLASMDKDNLKLDKVPALLQPIVEAAVDRARFRVEEQDGILELDLPEETIPLLADETHLSNAVFNLLDNAIKYSSGPPRIKVKVSLKDDHAVITVRDQGIGLTSDQQKHIFDKFYRVPTGNIHNVKGFGLGLNYVKYIIEAHGGEISLTSQIRKGSTFKIILPTGKPG